MPKSMMMASASFSIITFAGLRSRWTTPASCAALRPDATWRAMAITDVTGSRPDFLSTVARSSPSTNGIVMYLMPSISPMS